MRALVVYESAFGNTAEVARAVWEGVSQTVPDASLVEAGAAPAEPVSYTHLTLPTTERV